MQILGILDAAGKAIPNTTVTMFSCYEDRVIINDMVHKKSLSASSRANSTPFNYTKAEWDAEFEVCKERLKQYTVEVGNDPDFRVFPLEAREYANNRSIYERLTENKIGV